MAQLNPYEAPNALVRDSQPANNIGKAIVLIFGISLLTEIAAWWLLPLANGAIAELFCARGTENNWTARLASDSIFTFVLFSLASIASIKLTKVNPFFAALPIGFVGFFTFYIELGGFECLGNCGLPLWYDVVSIFRDIGACFLVALFVWVRGKRADT